MGEKKRGGEIKRKKKIGLAKIFRKKPTDAEYLLWGHLKGKQLGGHKFRRQVPIGDYIVDFACFSKKVVVEADGESHVNQQKEDQIRDEWFRCEGFKVLRFWNSDVLEDIDGVLYVIWKACGGDRKK